MKQADIMHIRHNGDGDCAAYKEYNTFTSREEKALGKRGNIKMGFIEVENSLTMMQFTEFESIVGEKVESGLAGKRDEPNNSCKVHRELVFTEFTKLNHPELSVALVANSPSPTTPPSYRFNEQLFHSTNPAAMAAPPEKMIGFEYLACQTLGRKIAYFPTLAMWDPGRKPF
ncbi:hypothetical protein J6590_000113 [Homalodisca vitripennis]|nr:hypothetical protein J6590_000113 [Homalodisca vitripennis]